ncbi:rab GTPase-binding effector protein 1 isoform X2 [Nematostella vectensis]|uniref:rab GTPase-binding effector protein 1 isoform X2 n=1 Tax=Nematostella vectensis TaxID=45351 RepID=UPI0020774C1C|nr:rab GTPase-binding effector protein 1 isoform X2 [Nematostella vectensis]
MAELGESDDQSLPQDVEALKSLVLQLQKRERELIWIKQEAENEFGRKRAQFKELYLSREAELDVQRSRADKAEGAFSDCQHKLQEAWNECETLRTTAALLESTQKEEMERIRSHFQEELASLQHIMKEAVKEARNGAAHQYEMERHSLIAANQKLGAQIKDLQNKLGQDGRNAGVMSAMTDAVAGVVKRSSAPSSPAPGGQSSDLEEGLKKENEGLKTRLKEAQEKLSTTENRLKELEGKKEKVKESETKGEHDSEELEEKVKELSQYLESERSARTDLEMYVAVLNTQKGVLQEDAEKLRNELHNVCRLIEQEKTAHRELKKTWQMANDQFLESQTLQNKEYIRVWNILTPEQKQTIEEQRHSSAEPAVGDLIDIITPNSSITSLESSHHSLGYLPNGPPSLVHLTNDVDAHPAENDRGESTTHQEGEREGESEERGRKRAYSASDLNNLEASNVDVSRAKSADHILTTGSPTPASIADDKAIRDSPLLDLATKPKTPTKGGRIDWQTFQEEVKLSHEGEISRACVMCQNYEHQLQAVQSERQKFKNLAANLQKALDQEKKALFEEQRLRSRLEESVANAGADAQAQINDQASTLAKLEKLMSSVQQKHDAAKDEATKTIAELVASRDELTSELERLRSEYNTLQDSALQQMTQMDSDARVTEMKEQLLQIRAAAEGTEEKLKSEIAFLKDRAVAEQMNKESMEEMLQAELDSVRAELATMSERLESEQKEHAQAEAKTQKSEQFLRNIEAKSKQVIIALRGQLDEASEEKVKLEEEVNRLKNQVQSLNSQLNESETVQRDFVKLSQTLQMQLAEMQESENEVRWEHKDDARECRNCQKPLNTNKDKYHCHHCGKIFCEGCRSKTFSNSSTRRPHQVCDACYATLTNDPKALLDAKLHENATLL